MDGRSALIAATVALATSLVSVVGCKRAEERPAATATTTAAAPATNDSAVTQITSARCEREVGCNNVGPGRKFADRDACERDLGHDAQVTFRIERCSGGIDQRKLTTCISEVRIESCGKPLDTIDLFPPCRAAQLCMESW